MKFYANRQSKRFTSTPEKSGTVFSSGPSQASLERHTRTVSLVSPKSSEKSWVRPLRCAGNKRGTIPVPSPRVGCPVASNTRLELNTTDTTPALLEPEVILPLEPRLPPSPRSDGWVGEMSADTRVTLTDIYEIARRSVKGLTMPSVTTPPVSSVTVPGSLPSATVALAGGEIRSPKWPTNTLVSRARRSTPNREGNRSSYTTPEIQPDAGESPSRPTRESGPSLTLVTTVPVGLSTLSLEPVYARPTRGCMGRVPERSREPLTPLSRPPTVTSLPTKSLTRSRVTGTGGTTRVRPVT